MEGETLVNLSEIFFRAVLSRVIRDLGDICSVTLCLPCSGGNGKAGGAGMFVTMT